MRSAVHRKSAGQSQPKPTLGVDHHINFALGTDPKYGDANGSPACTGHIRYAAFLIDRDASDSVHGEWKGFRRDEYFVFAFEVDFPNLISICHKQPFLK